MKQKHQAAARKHESVDSTVHQRVSTRSQGRRAPVVAHGNEHGNDAGKVMFQIKARPSLTLVQYSDEDESNSSELEEPPPPPPPPPPAPPQVEPELRDVGDTAVRSTRSSTRWQQNDAEENDAGDAVSSTRSGTRWQHTEDQETLAPSEPKNIDDSKNTVEFRVCESDSDKANDSVTVQEAECRRNVMEEGRGDVSQLDDSSHGDRSLKDMNDRSAPRHSRRLQKRDESPADNSHTQERHESDNGKTRKRSDSAHRHSGRDRRREPREPRDNDTGHRHERAHRREQDDKRVHQTDKKVRLTDNKQEDDIDIKTRQSEKKVKDKRLHEIEKLTHPVEVKIKKKRRTKPESSDDSSSSSGSSSSSDSSDSSSSSSGSDSSDSDTSDSTSSGHSGGRQKAPRKSKKESLKNNTHRRSEQSGSGKKLKVKCNIKSQAIHAGSMDVDIGISGGKDDRCHVGNDGDRRIRDRHNERGAGHGAGHEASDDYKTADVYHAGGDHVVTSSDDITSDDHKTSVDHIVDHKANDDHTVTDIADHKTSVDHMVAIADHKTSVDHMVAIADHKTSVDHVVASVDHKTSDDHTVTDIADHKTSVDHMVAIVDQESSVDHLVTDIGDHNTIEDHVVTSDDNKTSGDLVTTTDHKTSSDHTVISADHQTSGDHIVAGADHEPTVDHIITNADHKSRIDHIVTVGDHKQVEDHVDSSEDHKTKDGCKIGTDDTASISNHKSHDFRDEQKISHDHIVTSDSHNVDISNHNTSSDSHLVNRVISPKNISARSHNNSEVGDGPSERVTETRSEKSKVADHGSPDGSLVDEGSHTSEQVDSSAKSDRRGRRRRTSSETSHDGKRSRSRNKRNHQSQERRRDSRDRDVRHRDRDTDRHRDRRSSLDYRSRERRYEPRQRRRRSPSVERNRYRDRSRRRRSRSRSNSYDDRKSRYHSRRSDSDVRDRHRSHESPKRNMASDKAKPSSVLPKKSVSACNLPTELDSIPLPPMTSISTTSIASPSTVVTSVTATDSSLTVNVDNDSDIESVEMEDADDDTPTPREKPSVDIDDVKRQETGPVKVTTPKSTKFTFSMKTKLLRTPRVLTAFEDDDSEKPSQAKEMRKQVLQDALDQPPPEPDSVQGRLQAALLNLNLKAAKAKITPAEPQVKTDKTKHDKIKIATPTLVNRKSDKSEPSTTEKETLDGYKATFVDSFTSFSETDLAQPDDAKSIDDSDSQASVVSMASSGRSATDVSSSDSSMPEHSVSVSPDTVSIVSDCHKGVDVQSLTSHQFSPIVVSVPPPPPPPPRRTDVTEIASPPVAVPPVASIPTAIPTVALPRAPIRPVALPAFPAPMTFPPSALPLPMSPVIPPVLSSVPPCSIPPPSTITPAILVPPPPVPVVTSPLPVPTLASPLPPLSAPISLPLPTFPPMLPSPLVGLVSSSTVIQPPAIAPVPPTAPETKVPVLSLPTPGGTTCQHSNVTGIEFGVKSVKPRHRVSRWGGMAVTQPPGVATEPMLTASPLGGSTVSLVLSPPSGGATVPLLPQVSHVVALATSASDSSVTEKSGEPEGDGNMYDPFDVDDDTDEQGGGSEATDSQPTATEGSPPHPSMVAMETRQSVNWCDVVPEEKRVDTGGSDVDVCSPGRQEEDTEASVGSAISTNGKPRMSRWGEPLPLVDEVVTAVDEDVGGPVTPPAEPNMAEASQPTVMDSVEHQQDTCNHVDSQMVGDHTSSDHTTSDHVTYQRDVDDQVPSNREVGDHITSDREDSGQLHAVTESREDNEAMSPAPQKATTSQRHRGRRSSARSASSENSEESRPRRRSSRLQRLEEKKGHAKDDPKEELPSGGDHVTTEEKPNAEDRLSEPPTETKKEKPVRETERRSGKRKRGGRGSRWEKDSKAQQESFENTTLDASGVIASTTDTVSTTTPSVLSSPVQGADMNRREQYSSSGPGKLKSRWRCLSEMEAEAQGGSTANAEPPTTQSDVTMTAPSVVVTAEVVSSTLSAIQEERPLSVIPEESSPEREDFEPVDNKPVRSDIQSRLAEMASAESGTDQDAPPPPPPPPPPSLPPPYDDIIDNLYVSQR